MDKKKISNKILNIYVMYENDSLIVFTPSWRYAGIFVDVWKIVEHHFVFLLQNILYYIISIDFCRLNKVKLQYDKTGSKIPKLSYFYHIVFFSSKSALTCITLIYDLLNIIMTDNLNADVLFMK